MLLEAKNVKHVNSIAHEGKIVIFRTDTDGKIWYTVKQDGFEDSYLNTPADQRTGWEVWKELQFPNETRLDKDGNEIHPDQSVLDKEKAELTYKKDNVEHILLQSLYQTKDLSEVAPVQLVSAFGHIYVFRQSTRNTLLVDRFVLDGMTNELNRKLEVRFKRSGQKYTPLKNMKKGEKGLENIDSLDFRDANGKPFFEPTTELCLVANLQNGWFSVVLVPTIENDVYRWHIFAYNSQTKCVEITTLRASMEGLFDVKDYNFFEASGETLSPRKIPGIIRRTLDISGVTEITKGLAATKYDLQSGEEQLIRTATRLMLAIPTDKGTAVLSFAIGSDGILSQIDDTPEPTTLRAQQCEILLPLNTLDEIKAFGAASVEGIITGIAQGTSELATNDLVKISTEAGQAVDLNDGDLVTIADSSDYQGVYSVTTVEDGAFEIAPPKPVKNLGGWKKEGTSNLIFNGMITAYEKTQDDKLRVTCMNHGLETGDQVQIVGTNSYNATYPVQKVDAAHFLIESPWPIAEAIKLLPLKHRGMVFDGTNDYVEVPYSASLNSAHFTISCWVKVAGGAGSYRTPVMNRNDFTEPTTQKFVVQGFNIYANESNKWELLVGRKGGENGGEWGVITGPDIKSNTWTHIAGTYDGNVLTFYINGEVEGTLPMTDYIPNSARSFRIGSAYGSFLFSGQIAEVYLWNEARTAGEIKNSMNLQLTGKEIGLAGYWRLGGILEGNVPDEGKVLDFSVNGNDGVVHGEPYVNAATLERTLKVKDEIINVVKYSNPELFAVSECATYEESFEFKIVNGTMPASGKIFKFAYWGKASRSAEEIISYDDKDKDYVTQNEFLLLDDGWYRASCRVTIKKGVGMLRSFEIDSITGDWDSLEIRKHLIRLISDSVTEAKYTDGVTLAMLADNQATLAKKLQQIELQEKQKAALIREKQALEFKINAYNELEKTKAHLQDLRSQETTKKKNKEDSQTVYAKELNNPLNYFCHVSVKVQIYTKAICIKGQDEGDIISLVTWKDYGPGNQGNLFHFSTEDGVNYKIGVQGISGTWKGVHVKDQAQKDGAAFVRYGSLTSGNVFRFDLQPDGYYISVMVDNAWKGVHVSQQYYFDNTELVRWTGKGNRFDIYSTGEISNTKRIEKFRQDWEDKKSQLKSLQIDIANIQAVVDIAKQTDGGAYLTAWSTRLLDVEKRLEAVGLKLSELNRDFLAGKTNPIIQDMPQVACDHKGLVTQGALLDFVQPASRLIAMETCEGNVQLSYFDTQGRLRQTNYDATADSRNSTFGQWLADAQRACLNFDNNKSLVMLDTALDLPFDWSIEAWFSYPLPETEKWNTKKWYTLIAGARDGYHIIVQNRKELGIFIDGDPLGQGFYASGFDMETLANGWHHLAAVGRGDSTLFYVDGKKVGDTKAKALAEAEEYLKKTPDSTDAKKKVEDIKNAILKVPNPVYTIGKDHWDTGQPFGKVAEVRIWGLALSDEEIAVNSKTLLSGNEPGLLAYYPLDEATGNKVRDSSGQGHNGTVTGASWWGCTASIGKIENLVMQFDGVDDYVSLPEMNIDFSQGFTVESWVWYDSLKQWSRVIDLGNGPQADNILFANVGNTAALNFEVYLGNGGSAQTISAPGVLETGKWIHLAATLEASGKVMLYKNGVLIQSGQMKLPNKVLRTKNYLGKSNWTENGYLDGKLSEVRIWKVARTEEEIQKNMQTCLTGTERNLLAYYPLSEIIEDNATQKVLDLVSEHHGTVHNSRIVLAHTLESLVCSEYSTITVDPDNGNTATMRRLFTCPGEEGVLLLQDKRIETLELMWIGNAQFAPSLLGYIEGPPPVPSENLTLSDDYNGATSVELTISEDMELSWKRSQDAGLGGKVDLYWGGGGDVSWGVGFEIRTASSVGFKGALDTSYKFQNESNIASKSSLSKTDKLELRGTPEEIPNFPHLGKRFIPKNVGYALVVSALADVRVTRLARSRKMVGYLIQPVEDIPPDVNTITFLMNPAYTMNGSLDGLTGSSATSQRFFKHVPQMRAQYGSLYPASYYRLQEAYNLKKQIEAEDARREAYFANFDVHTVDETSLSRNINSGAAPVEVGVKREDDKPDAQMTESEKQKAQDEAGKQFQKETDEAAAKTSAAAKVKQTDIENRISDQEKRETALTCFAAWQNKMELLQTQAGKRNIVNTYVWDADGGLRIEQQSFANTVQHTIGGSFSLNAELGVAAKIEGTSSNAELTALATVNLTQTLSKTESLSKGLQLNVSLGGLEHKGITDYNDRPIQPGEKVDRYRFMSFYLEGSTQNFQDFFNYVVDPEWLASNDEEARALRQARGKPNETWRVLHRVTYVERPALMGFGQDLRKVRATAEQSESKVLLDRIANLEQNNKRLDAKLDQILQSLTPLGTLPAASDKLAANDTDLAAALGELGQTLIPALGRKIDQVGQQLTPLKDLPAASDKLAANDKDLAAALGEIGQTLIPGLGTKIDQVGQQLTPLKDLPAASDKLAANDKDLAAVLGELGQTLIPALGTKIDQVGQQLTPLKGLPAASDKLAANDKDLEAMLDQIGKRLMPLEDLPEASKTLAGNDKKLDTKLDHISQLITPLENISVTSNTLAEKEKVLEEKLDQILESLPPGRTDGDKHNGKGKH